MCGGPSVDPLAGAARDAEALAVDALDADAGRACRAGSSSATLETWIGPGRSITPPTRLGALRAGDLSRALVALDHVQPVDVDALA